MWKSRKRKRQRNRHRSIKRQTRQPERLETRRLLAADAIHVGVVYLETDYLESDQDVGSDSRGDRFILSFTGGAPDTELSEFRIRTDKDGDGLSVGDPMFDTALGGRGKGGAHDFQVVRVRTSDGHSIDATAEVQDGGQELVIRLKNFHAGDRLEFTIDVDEIVRSSIDLAIFNDRLDVITSGQEFQDSILEATFEAPHYETSQADAIFANDYGDPATALGLDLPADEGDDIDSRPNRSAAAIADASQTPKPIEIAGQVWIDNNLDTLRETGEAGLGGVPISLWRQTPSGNYEETGHRVWTNSDGSYQFDRSLGLMPGTYRVVQHQPDHYYSVGAIAGTTDGATNGRVESDNVISEIHLPLGDTTSINQNFAEAAPASLSGFVYRDLDQDGRRDAGEGGIGGVSIRLVPVHTLAEQASLTATTLSDGSYQFEPLAPGTYEVIEVDQPNDFSDGLESAGTVDGRTVGIPHNPGDRIAAIQLGGSDEGIEFNFGELPLGSLSGAVFHPPMGSDCEGGPETSGIQPLGGVLVTLRNDSGETIAETVTDSIGRYRFTRLPAGTYALIETTPAGLIDGDAHVGSMDGVQVGIGVGGGMIQDIMLNPGGIGQDYDFCEAVPASISGRVYHDASNDGKHDTGESAIPAVAISLIDAQGHLVATSETDADGRYEFLGVLPGQYTLRQQQPFGFLDGIDTAGTIRGRTVGQSDGLDSLTSITLNQGDEGIDYNFGELMTASLSGLVHSDRDGDCQLDPAESIVSGVEVRLLNVDGVAVAETTTDATGSYRFVDLEPGQYSVEQIQPPGYFDGGAVVGDAGGTVVGGNRIDAISLVSGSRATGYNFCEMLPATISGTVFQDGPVRKVDATPDPSQLREFQDGILTEDDERLGGVILELRDMSGHPVDASVALPGFYAAGPIRATTIDDGFYAFPGLPPGTYHVYQAHPESYVDGLDTPGSTGGFAVNAADASNPDSLLMIEQLRQSVSTDPREDAILNIAVAAGDVSTGNNFSELIFELPTITYVPYLEPVVVPGMTEIPFHVESFDNPIRLTSFPSPGGTIPSLDPYRMLWDAMDEWAVSWHLSVINGGYPRGMIVDAGNVHRVSVMSLQPTWNEGAHAKGYWTIHALGDSGHPRPTITLGEKGATALAGDFNGDGVDESAIYVGGQWYVDLNGDGQWNPGDLWIQLGNELDRPIVGDWDGDGKDDVAIFGRQWQRDYLRIIRDPGLPDPANHRRRTADPRAMRPSLEERGDDPRRLLRRGDDGMLRADAVDHVFQYGEQVDMPVAGDWNGDGIDQVGVFRGGFWMLDMDGDGRWNQPDQRVEFGRPGDIPIVGDFNGDEIDEIGVVRGDRWIIDTDGDRRLTGNDLQIEVPRLGKEGQPVVGDFDGDGKDEPAYYDEAG